jgi:ABC-type polysaccharide/polyol phosphate export permease
MDTSTEQADSQRSAEHAREPWRPMPAKGPDTPDGPRLDKPIQRSAGGTAADRPGTTFGEMVQELVVYRELLRQMVQRDLKLRYKQAIMGIGWAVFMPVLIVVAGCLVKYAMARATGQPLAAPSIAGMSIKALGWSFFVGSLSFAVSSLTGNINLVTKIYFPREVFPLSAVLTQVCDTLIGAVAVAVIVAVFAPVGASLQLLWLPLLAGLLVLLVTGVALLLSCANVFFRDVKYVVQVILMFGIFFTPVFYEPEMFGPQGCKLMMLNPVAPLLDGLRLAVVEHHNLLAPLTVVVSGRAEILVWSPWYLAYAAAWSVLGLLGSWWLFHKLEFVYPEYI